MNQNSQSGLIKGKDLIGLKILTLENGKLIKDVDELVFDPQTNQVKALVVDPGGWFADANVVMFSDIKSISEDSIVIESEDLIKKASQVHAQISRIVKDDNFLTKNRVMTEDGKELGNITDIFFDPSSGDVKELEISEGLLENMQSGKKRVRVSDVVKVGEDAIIVKTFVEDSLEHQAESQGIQGAVNTAKDKASEMIDQTK